MRKLAYRVQVRRQSEREWELPFLTKRTHVVQFYDAEGMLISQVGHAMWVALDQGAAVVCVATGMHRWRLERYLIVRGVDIEEARAANQLVCLDAPAILERVTTKGVPDAARFIDVVGAVIDQAAARFPLVWVFGELVALLCADGHHSGALELERMWTSFMDSRPQVILYCAYPTDVFKSADHRQVFAHICEEHGRVLHSDRSLAFAP